MKKFLSLVLALIMTMSLVTISAGAKEFKDDDKITYDEAIAVISEIGVVDGYEDGSFNPQGTLTRGAAAKIICNMILGPTTAAELHADTAPYKDVPINHTFAGYIAYCAKEGIISGYADGTFRPAGTLTGYAFMKMLLGALGYDSTREGYTGANWSINVAKQALAIGLNKGLEGDFNGIKAVNREEAALYAFNTLKADLVEYSSTILVGDVTITGADEKAMEWKNSATRRDNIKDDEYVQFAEQYFNKLVRSDETDDFGRPANEWTYDKKDIGTYVNKDLLVASYTTKVEGGDVYSDIGSAACDFDLTYYVNGVALTKDQTKTEAAKLEKKNDDTVGKQTGLVGTGNGVLTEVFADSDKEETTIVEIHTYLAQATSDYNSKTEKLPLKVYVDVDGSGATPTEKVISRTVSVDDFDIDSYEKDDFVLVTYAGKDKEIKSVEAPEIISDVEVTSYSVNGKDDDIDPYMMKKITAEGTKYDASKDAAYDAECLWNYDMSELKDNTYNVILDKYGYVIGLEKEDGSTNYAFLVGYEVSSSYLATAIDKALVILVDDENNAEMKVVDIRDDKMKSTNDALQLFGQAKAKSHVAINKWVTYEMNDDVMVLKTCVDDQYRDATMIGNTIDREMTTLEGNLIDAAGSGFSGTSVVKYGNAKTMYIAVDADDSVHDDGSIVKINGVSVGIKNTSIDVKAGTKNAKGAYVMYDGGYVKYAVVVGEDGSIADRLVYLTDGITEKYYDKERDQDIYVYEGIVGGELNDRILSEVANDNTLAGNNLLAGHLYVASYDAEGVITEMEPEPQNWYKAKTTENKSDKYVLAISGTSVTVGGSTYTLPADTKLELKGMTLYITAASNNHYVLLDDECNFYIRGTDEKGKRDSDYELYTDADNAMSVLGKASIFTGSFVAICDPDTGYATTIIIDDAKYEHDADTPAATGEITLSNVKIGGKTVAAATGYADLDDAIENAKTVYLSAAQLTAGLSDYTANSTLTTTGAIQAVYKVFADEDAAYDFVPGDKDNDASDTVVVSGKTITVAAANAPALGDGDLVIIRVNDNADAFSTGNLTWFAYIVSEKID